MVLSNNLILKNNYWKGIFKSYNKDCWQAGPSFLLVIQRKVGGNDNPPPPPKPTLFLLEASIDYFIYFLVCLGFFSVLFRKAVVLFTVRKEEVATAEVRRSRRELNAAIERYKPC